MKPIGVTGTGKLFTAIAVFGLVGCGGEDRPAKGDMGPENAVVEPESSDQPVPPPSGHDETAGIVFPGIVTDHEPDIGNGPPLTKSPPQDSEADAADPTGAARDMSLPQDDESSLTGMARVEAAARSLASKPYEPPPATPKAASQLDYDQFRRIQNLDGSILWEGDLAGYRVHLDPSGYLFSHRIKLNIVENGEVTEKSYAPGQFDFFDLPLDEEAKQALGYSGFRVLSAFNRAGKFDEVISFRGASFFRALGAGTLYGASARGISIGTASSEGEEFPVFREFWLEKPQAGDDGITLYALLDGKSVTGAFAFRVEPGPDTQVHVQASIIPRRQLENFGIVPLTSMYYFSPHDAVKQRDDFRPAVHDSQGLSFRLRNGEWVWRPLSNPQQLQMSILASDVPLGFGLMQRQRDFDAYSDIEAGYHLRPSVWVEPGQGWEKGELTLVEIPTSNEYNDNIVVFWKPGKAWEKGAEHHFSYTLHWALNPPAIPSVAAVSQTRSGQVPNSGNRLFVIDFEPTNTELLEAAEANVSASAGEVSNVTIKHQHETGLTRLSFELDPGSAQVVELRALLTRGGKAVTETWIYRWRAS